MGAKEDIYSTKTRCSCTWELKYHGSDVIKSAIVRMLTGRVSITPPEGNETQTHAQFQPCSASYDQDNPHWANLMLRGWGWRWYAPNKIKLRATYS